MLRTLAAVSTLALAIATPALAAEPAKDAAKWDVNAPPGMKTRAVAIDTTEGTWMNLDVSPDGKRIAFDLLGDIYVMPIEGGTPTRIAEGLAYETQPRFSPDGTRIAFTSDRGGGDNIWIMNADGTDKRQLTTENFRLMNQASWSPDGQYIVAKKHFTTQRSLGTGEVWLFHVSGGAGVQLVKRPNETHQKELGEPIFAPDGKHIYFTRNTTPGGTFLYAQDTNNEIFAIERYDLETGETDRMIGGEGGAVRPTPSPDGTKIAYVRRERTRSKLYVRDLATGSDRKVYDALDQDMQETWAVTGVYPNMAWTPDSKAIVFWAGGKLNRLDMASGKASNIPFRVADTRAVIDPPRPAIPVAPASFNTTMPRGATVSPDGSQIVFETLGKLWIKPASGGAARRLTAENEAMEAYPAWSADGRRVAYVRWTDAGLGEIRTVAPDGSGAVKVTKVAGHYARPAFSPDGSTIVFEKQQGGGLVSPRNSTEPGIYKVSASGGTPERVLRDGAHPQFAADSTRVFTVVSENNKTRLVSTDLNGEARRVHAEGELVNDYAVSPDGRFFAFRQNYQAFVMPMLPGTQTLAAAPSGTPLPVTKASRDGADWIHWSAGGNKLHWSLGPTLFTADRASFFANAPGARASKYSPPASGISLSMPVTLSKPAGAVAITGARIVTMNGTDGGIIEDGAILIEGDRIKAVGPRGSVAIPSGTPTVDATGKTIIPGLVDAHAHGPYGVDEITLQSNWSELANLAFGVTTRHDPSSRAALVYPQLEMQRAGLVLGPRSFSTGEIVYGAKSPQVYAEINSYDDALAHVRRLKAQGAFSIKNYNQPRREQRQQVMKAAIAENMRSVAEGGSLFGMDMTLVADGNTTLEHNVPVDIMYQDVLQFFSRSKVGYTPTLVVTYGGPAGDPYWRAHTDLLKHPLLTRHQPASVLAASSARREIAPEGDYADDDNAREAAKLARLGVPVSIGAHGQEAGIAAHWELWSFVRGGMTPVEALRAGTIESARSLGFDADIGSLVPGKLADLVVLDADPTKDIRNSDKVAKVMIGGRLYDAATLNEEVTGTRKRPAYWWEGETGGGGTGPAGGLAADTD
ncbi:amidohydrolase family protein [Novosphingobium sp. TH158]|uniref:amidohydrolase family protein n=1 Tax=Novosphingobium sp. TH158 TaxID=2067455 RepID=UPI000C7B90EA|nr:amidohydrolase family protein [Novosphingobium sp. TH158]PLK25776.1 amidohydrolase [Novosphingobium sp. TH158]